MIMETCEEGVVSNGEQEGKKAKTSIEEIAAQSLYYAGDTPVSRQRYRNKLTNMLSMTCIS